MPDLNKRSDFEAEVFIEEKDATSGEWKPSTGLTGVTLRIATTKTGAAVGSLTGTSTERPGSPGLYALVFDAAALTSALTAGGLIYLIASKSGDFDAEFAEYTVVDATPLR